MPGVTPVVALQAKGARPEPNHLWTRPLLAFSCWLPPLFQFMAPVEAVEVEAEVVLDRFVCRHC